MAVSMFARASRLFPVLMLTLGQNSLWAGSNYPAVSTGREEELRHFCAMEKNAPELCPPGPIHQRSTLHPAVQEKLASELNGELACATIHFSEGEQMTRGRDTSLPECDPSQVMDFREAARRLNALADVCLPQDAQPLRAKAEALQGIERGLIKVKQLRRQLEEFKVIARTQRGEWMIDYVGHPFQKSNHADLLARYAEAVRELESRWSPSFERCPEAICDPVLLKLAEAVALRPADSASPPAGPNPYDLRVFSQRYFGDPDVGRALGINPKLNFDFAYENEIYTPVAAREGKAVLYKRAFANSGIVVGIGEWALSASPVSMFYLLQEARVFVDEIVSLRALGYGGAEAIRELRFENSDGTGRLLQLSDTPESGRTLILTVIGLPDDPPVEAVRQRIRHQILFYLSVIQSGDQN